MAQQIIHEPLDTSLTSSPIAVPVAHTCLLSAFFCDTPWTFLLQAFCTFSFSWKVLPLDSYMAHSLTTVRPLDKRPLTPLYLTQHIYLC